MDNLNFSNTAIKILPESKKIDDLALSFSLLSGKMERIVAFNETFPEFKPVTRESMSVIMPYLEKAPGRTTDFSYGGLLMWVDYFRYEYSIFRDTLFIKGAVENDLTRNAFAMPIGEMSLGESLGVMKSLCKASDSPLVLSAVPEECLESLSAYLPKSVEPLEDWGDYIYSAEDLAYLRGKKFSKKRNHVNQFIGLYPDWKLEEITTENAMKAMSFMDIFDLEGDDTPMAAEERRLSREMIGHLANGDTTLKGALLYAGDAVCAYTIGDLRGDTLFIHIEKATRKVAGSYEAINSFFARNMLERNPGIKYINREDDSGDSGLRFAKESYHPLAILKKYNVIF